MSDPPVAPVGWLRAVVVDADDSERLSSFWRSVLGVGLAEVQPDWIQLAPDPGGVYLAFQPSAGAERPAVVRLRPDIEVEDMDVAQERIEQLGGRLVEIVHEPGGETHRRMADPEGNQFTILLPLPD